MNSHHVANRGQVFRAVISASSSGDNTLVAGITNAKIIVLGVFAMAASAVAGTFKSGSTSITGALPVGANGGFVMPHNPVGWLKCGAGESLVLNLDSAVAVGGVVVYQVVSTQVPQ